MYPGGLRQLVEGWSKNLAGGARLTAPLPTLGAVVWVVATAAAATAGVVAVLEAAGGGAVPREVIVGWAVVSLQLRWLLRRIGTYRWWVAAAFPVPLLAFVVLFLRSLTMRSVRRRVTWRGRWIGLQDGTS
jgi:4,4'-diaponeurosporenoate glycosyltransferase